MASAITTAAQLESQLTATWTSVYKKVISQAVARGESTSVASEAHVTASKEADRIVGIHLEAANMQIRLQQELSALDGTLSLEDQPASSSSASSMHATPSLQAIRGAALTSESMRIDAAERTAVPTSPSVSPVADRKKRREFNDVAMEEQETPVGLPMNLTPAPPVHLTAPAGPAGSSVETPVEQRMPMQKAMYGVPSAPRDWARTATRSSDGGLMNQTEPIENTPDAWTSWPEDWDGQQGQTLTAAQEWRKAEAVAMGTMSLREDTPRRPNMTYIGTIDTPEGREDVVRDPSTGQHFHIRQFERNPVLEPMLEPVPVGTRITAQRRATLPGTPTQLTVNVQQTATPMPAPAPVQTSSRTLRSGRREQRAPREHSDADLEALQLRATPDWMRDGRSDLAAWREDASRVINFGKHKFRACFYDLPAHDPGYLRWVKDRVSVRSSEELIRLARWWWMQEQLQALGRA
jgi:hypothetical protein